MIDGKKFQSRSATLGNALAGENGVHTNPFGGGASAPVIRGQEGVRVKMLQNGSDVVDMSAISPDHAVASDTLLAKQVEIVRGTPTLLYSSASPAGVVNITDSRIPEKVPEKGYEAKCSSAPIRPAKNAPPQRALPSAWAAAARCVWRV
ncbi:TonB-dependent receptor plug domain-containing protein [Neisseria bacilliformis]|uniref:TonB-dependent receptor plug domain-containing protein n=1 Tax=Neisseria bacilliformis TaxID=267212 RepID=UPI00069E8F74|nr:Plug domain-containing protein [Neisseria bacilliformis]